MYFPEQVLWKAGAAVSGKEELLSTKSFVQLTRLLAKRPINLIFCRHSQPGSGGKATPGRKAAEAPPVSAEEDEDEEEEIARARARARARVAAEAEAEAAARASAAKGSAAAPAMKEPREARRQRYTTAPRQLTPTGGQTKKRTSLLRRFGEALELSEDSDVDSELEISSSDSSALDEDSDDNGNEPASVPPLRPRQQPRQAAAERAAAAAEEAARLGATQGVTQGEDEAEALRFAAAGGQLAVYKLAHHGSNGAAQGLPSLELQHERFFWLDAASATGPMLCWDKKKTRIPSQKKGSALSLSLSLCLSVSLSR